MQLYLNKKNTYAHVMNFNNKNFYYTYGLGIMPITVALTTRVTTYLGK